MDFCNKTSGYAGWLIEELIKELVDSDVRNIATGYHKYKDSLYELKIKVDKEPLSQFDTATQDKSNTIEESEND